MDGPDTAPPTVMDGTGKLYHSQVKQIGVRLGNLGTSWFGFLSLIINYILYSVHSPLQRKTLGSRLTNLFSEQAISNSNKSTSCSHDSYALPNEHSRP
jgi:hypothetical protein